MKKSSNPLAIDLYAGLGGWTAALLAEGWDVIGFDNERHQYRAKCPVCDGTGNFYRNDEDGDFLECDCWVDLDNYGSILSKYPGQLVLQDVCTLHGAQFVDADLIVASSPCQEFSYRAMPWKRAKALGPPVLGINLFWQAFRIQHEIFETCGRHVPLVAENVRGAQPWVGRAVFNYGSFYLWGDIPALMPRPMARGQKRNPDGTNHGTGSWFAIADSKNRGASGNGARFTTRDCGVEGIKQHGSGPEWFDNGIAKHSGKSRSRKAASAQIAKIPEPLARHIAQVYKP